MLLVFVPPNLLCYAYYMYVEKKSQMENSCVAWNKKRIKFMSTFFLAWRERVYQHGIHFPSIKSICHENKRRLDYLCMLCVHFILTLYMPLPEIANFSCQGSHVSIPLGKFLCQGSMALGKFLCQVSMALGNFWCQVSMVFGKSKPNGNVYFIFPWICIVVCHI